MSSTALTGASISPATRGKTRKTALSRQERVGILFGFIVTIPTWLALAFPNLAASFIYQHGPWPETGLQFVYALWPLFAFEVIAFVAAVPCLVLAKRKDGAK